MSHGAAPQGGQRVPRRVRRPQVEAPGAADKGPVVEEDAEELGEGDGEEGEVDPTPPGDEERHDGAEEERSRGGRDEREGEPARDPLLRHPEEIPDRLEAGQC